MVRLEPGDTLDHYRLIERVADGGMATVFRAVDLRSKSQVGIKVPHPEAECDPALFTRFQREAEIGRTMDHPGILQVFPAESSRRVYFVMEWVEGTSLRTLLTAQKRFSVERAIRIAANLCDALAHIHERGVVHRDLKPENIIVEAKDKVKLIDFGIAAHAGSRRVTFGRLSQAMGTPDYVAPEQVKGKRGDARTDIYGLGAILYEMLSGEPPFTGDSPLIVLNSRLKNSPASLREHTKEVTAELDAVVLRALEPEPIHRYQNMKEFQAELLRPPAIGEKPARETKPSRRPYLFYSILTSIPVAIFGLLLYVASHQ